MALGLRRPRRDVLPVRPETDAVEDDECLASRIAPERTIVRNLDTGTRPEAASGRVSGRPTMEHVGTARSAMEDDIADVSLGSDAL